ncbi:MAG: serine/threonine-protein phosphatase [Leptolyngbyaceae cyanobacterium T60_A2020_046]|nr:serine/threonine-protein phosphatase [Leptolyngbyaceae cyanobacterium T60_A2020_046]
MISVERVTSRDIPYLWAIGPGCESMTVGQRVGDRYEVVSPQVWRDTIADPAPVIPDSVPETVLRYLKAHPLRLHIPGVYDVVPQRGKAPIVLLENAPINPRSGKVFPRLIDAWGSASALRQLSWLWQLWQLWQSLLPLGTAGSLLDPDILRVEGWRVRLCQLQVDDVALSDADLAAFWQSLIAGAQPAIAEPLQHLCQAIAAGTCDAEQITVDLNYLLLKESAQVPLRLRVAGATSPGPRHDRNEDACYPDGVAPASPLPRLAIVCDGVGGHEAGEVASQRVVRSLHLQLQGLLLESDGQEILAPPKVIAQQIEAAIRVANDLINRQNDEQNRSDRQRMGTTLVMALMVPQRIQTDQGWRQANELYIAHVGDSRAYWITPDYCHLLTVDDDLAGRETVAGRQFYSALRDRPEAGALTQAIGTRSGDYLAPHVQRFVIDEEGILLLCSDGLSDNQRIEGAWGNYIGLITKDIISLDAAVASWVELANQKNGHDNVAVVLMHCRPLGEAAYPSGAAAPEAAPNTDTPDTPDTELTEASRALLYDDPEVGDPARETTTQSANATPVTVPIWWVAIVASAILLAAGFIGWWGAGRLAPPAEPPAEPEAPATPE